MHARTARGDARGPASRPQGRPSTGGRPDSARRPRCLRQGPGKARGGFLPGPPRCEDAGSIFPPALCHAGRGRESSFHPQPGGGRSGAPLSTASVRGGSVPGKPGGAAAGRSRAVFTPSPAAWRASGVTTRPVLISAGCGERLCRLRPPQVLPREDVKI